MSAERRRLSVALLLSLLAHALLLSLTFGGQGWGLPGLGFPWQERRGAVPDLRVVLMPAPVAAAESANTPVEAPLPPASIEQAVAIVPARTPTVPAPDPAAEANASQTEQAAPRA